MNYKKILNVVGVTAVAVVFSLGCGERQPEDPPEYPIIPPDTPSISDNPNNQNNNGSKGSDISNYRTVIIGTQKWMAENLDYDVPGSVCYQNSADNCAIYGRLYSWDEAMNGASSSSANPSGVQGICPAGWHLPSDAEWTTLTTFVGGESTAGTKLKATSGWDNNGNGTDNHGFSALPGGYGHWGGGGFVNAGYSGFWWSATETFIATVAWGWIMSYDSERAIRFEGHRVMFSVRCVQD